MTKEWIWNIFQLLCTFHVYFFLNVRIYDLSMMHTWETLVFLFNIFPLSSTFLTHTFKNNVSFLHGKTMSPRIFFSPQAEVFPRAAFTPEGRLYARAKRGL